MPRWLRRNPGIERRIKSRSPADREITAMRKADIARHIHQQAGILEYEAAKVLDWILGLLKTTLHAGEPITIQGFGRFTVRSKGARRGRNPKTGETMMISPRRVVTFHPSLRFRTEVNSVPAERQEAVTRTRKKVASAEGNVTWPGPER